MSKVLFVYEREIPTVTLTRNTFQRLSEKWKVSSRFLQLTDVQRKDIEEADVLFLIRPEDILSVTLARKARQAGCFVITFCDDDLLNLPPEIVRAPWRRKMLQATLHASDMILSSSQRICERYAEYTGGKRIALIDTTVDPDECIQPRDASHTEGKIKIVYAAAPSHAALFDAYVRPAIPKLVEDYGDRISLHFISVHPELDEYRDRVEINYHAGMPLAEYRQFMAESAFDIGIAPGADSEFFKCKYFNKFIEYSMQGVAGVYSKLEPYTYAVQDRENGLLAENTADGWYEALKAYIEEPELRRSCAEKARETLLEKHHEDAVLGRLFTQVPEMQFMTKNGRQCASLWSGKLVYYGLRPFELLYLSVATMRTTGISGFWKKFQIHIRERKMGGR